MSIIVGLEDGPIVQNKLKVIQIVQYPQQTTWKAKSCLKPGNYFQSLSRQLGKQSKAWNLGTICKVDLHLSDTCRSNEEKVAKTFQSTRHRGDHKRSLSNLMSCYSGRWRRRAFGIVVLRKMSSQLGMGLGSHRSCSALGHDFRYEWINDVRNQKAPWSCFQTRHSLAYLNWSIKAGSFGNKGSVTARKGRRVCARTSATRSWKFFLGLSSRQIQKRATVKLQQT